MTQKAKQTPVTKPFLKGKPTDRNTVKKAAGFFGVLLMMTFVSVLACSMFLSGNNVIRIILNAAVEILILTICFTNGSSRGTDDVAKGEVLLQQRNDGRMDDPLEVPTPWHPLKGLLTAVLGTLPILIIAMILALTAQKVMTGSGALPGWVDAYLERDGVGEALSAYARTTPMTVTSAARMLVRLFLMPFVSIIGAENKDTMLLLERLSPLLVLLPAIAYGIGYLQGPTLRTRVHTEIHENLKKRKKKETKERKKRAAAIKAPEQLN